MPTRKLFYEDPLLQEFSATVTGCTPEKQGFAITLDATAFYPEGGGQSWDTGTLGDAQVLSVTEQDGDVVHFCTQPLPVGSRVSGKLDWQRRLDLMQQHTGEHILSGLMFSHFGCHNTGFHVGKEYMEVDFDCFPSWQQLQEIEQQANQAVWEDIPLKCWFPRPQDLGHIPYRSKRPLEGDVRLVEIPGYDCCACCGVHTARTGQVGVIKILSAVRFHQGVRLQLVCGGRAYRYLRDIFDQAKQISAALSAKMPAIAAAADQLKDALSAEKIRSADLERELFRRIALDYVNQENVLYFANGFTPAQVRNLAEAISRVCPGVAGVFSPAETGYSYCLCSQNADLRPLGKLLNARLSGRGGGKEQVQQGTVCTQKAEIENFFVSCVNSNR